MPRHVPLLPLAPLLVACAGGADPDDALDPDGPLYLAASWVSDVDDTNTYVSLLDELEAGSLDFADAIEVPGWADAWVYDGAVFIASGEAPNVARYRVTDEGTLEQELEIGFANFGVFGAAFWDQQFLTPTQAWLSDPAGRQYIVWDPTAMAIVGTVPWPEVTFDDGLEVFHSYTDRGGVVVGDVFFHGLYGHNELWNQFGDRSYVVAWDVPSQTVLDVIEVPCPMMDVASLGDDGFLYVSGWSYMPLSEEAGLSDVNCAARIDVASRTLDPSWQLDYRAATGGRPGSALRAVDGDEGIFAVFHGSGVPVRDGMDMWELDVADDDWELFAIDLATQEAEPTGVRMGDGSYYESHIDDRYFVYLGGNERTQVYERTDGGYVPTLDALGWMSRLFRVR